MVPFGGWDMPLNYGEGTIAEHKACRAAAVAFDVSHLGTVRVTGNGARDLLQGTLTADLANVEPGNPKTIEMTAGDPNETNAGRANSRNVACRDRDWRPIGNPYDPFVWHGSCSSPLDSP